VYVYIQRQFETTLILNIHIPSLVRKKNSGIHKRVALMSYRH